AQPDQAWVKRWEIVGQELWRIPLRVNGNEKRLDLLCGLAQLVQRQADRLQVGGAHVRAMGEAEINQQKLAAELGLRARLTGMIDQGERPADRLAVPHQHVHQLRGGTFALLLRAHGCEQHQRDARTKSEERADRWSRSHAPKIMRLPIVASTSFSGICSRTAWMKLIP